MDAVHGYHLQTTPADPLQIEAIFVDKVFLGMKPLTQTGRQNLGRISFEIRILKSEY